MKLIRLNNKEFRCKVNSESERLKKAVFLVTGASGKALSERFDDISEALKENDFFFLRYESWNDGKSLGEKNNL